MAPPEWQEAFAAPPAEAAVHHLFANDVRGDLQGQLARVWQAVAAYFRGDRNVLGYELYNEPAWIMDEFGASVTDTSGVSATVGEAEALGLSWTYWSALQAHDPTGGPDEGLIDQRTRRPNGPLSAVLAVPYPWATAGTPGPHSFDAATDAFSYRYRVARSSAAPTEIVLPRAAYPRGYRASVHGARVVSRAGAGVLELAAQRGAATVSLRVTPLSTARR